jgi:hypothetical protein
MPMRANIVEPPSVATRIKASIAACHSAASCEMRVRCYLLSGGLSPAPDLLSGFDRLSVPDRRSPTSCFSASERVPFQIVVLSRFAYRRPTASHRCPSWFPRGCRESCWIARDYRTKAAPEGLAISSTASRAVWNFCLQGRFACRRDAIRRAPAGMHPDVNS